MPRSMLRLLLIVWVAPLATSLGLVGLLYLGSLSEKFDTPYLSPNSLASVAGDMLQFIGLVTAILFGVLTAIHNQSRANLISGFGTIRQAVDGLNLLINQMYSGLSRTSGDDKVVLQEWIRATEALVGRMNLMTIAWPGWDSETGLEGELSQYHGARARAQAQAGLFIAGDAVWVHINTEYDKWARDILTGLLVMDEGVVGGNLVRRLMRLFASLLSVLTFIIVVRLISDIVYQGGAPILLNIFVGAAMGSVAIAHMFYLGWEVVLWRKDIKNRDDAWAS